MARETLTLKKGYREMTPEEWWTNMDCDKVKRAHKWRWKLDIASGVASIDQAVCVHCGREATLTRDKITVKDKE